MPSYTGPLTLTATTGDAFRASREAAHMRRWLREVRGDMSAEACRQVVHYARALIDIFGDETPALVASAPAEFQARLDAVDLERRGYPAQAYRYLLRAGRALHAAVHDLDTEQARALMDQRTRRRTRARAGAARNTEAALPVGDDGQVPSPAAATTEALAADVQALLTAVEQELTAQRELDGALDARRATRAVLAGLSPAARLTVAARLPGAAAEVPVDVQTNTPTLTDLADEAIVAAMARRYAPAQAA